MAGPTTSPPLQPIFISGSYHRELQFGSEVRPAGLVIAELAERKKAAELRAARGGAAQARQQRRGKSSSVTLRDLLQGGYIQAAPQGGRLTVFTTTTTTTAPATSDPAFTTHTHHATLLPTGQVQFNGQVLGSLAELCKRTGKQLHPGEDGWRFVYVDGTLVEDHRQRLLNVRAAGQAPPGLLPAPSPSIYQRQLPSGDLPPLPSTFDIQLPKLQAPEEAEQETAAEEAGGGDAEAGDDTSNWVQCSRCQVWRMVPDDFWPDIEAAGDEDWYCEEATWELTAYDPFTKGCKEFAGVKG